MSKSEVKHTLLKASKVAIACSYHILNARNSTSWDPINLSTLLLNLCTFFFTYHDSLLFTFCVLNYYLALAKSPRANLWPRLHCTLYRNINVSLAFVHMIAIARHGSADSAIAECLYHWYHSVILFTCTKTGSLSVKHNRRQYFIERSRTQILTSKIAMEMLIQRQLSASGLNYISLLTFAWIFIHSVIFL